jgi:two-component system, chemotaxis family, protein-glutamate methylesterase/glutaminase
MSAPRIRVLVVDDSAFARKVVREVLEGDPRFEVVGTARDGLDGLEKMSALLPDVVTLDLVMPNLGGIGLLQALPTLGIAKLPRVVVVTMSELSSELAVSALQSGAIALVHKPTALATDRLFELADELRTAVASAAAATTLPGALSSSAGERPIAPVTATSSRRVVAIGTSTGGPQALTLLLAQIPKAFPVPIVIALHMPVGYTEALARRLDQASAIEVVEAYDGVELLPGRAIVARAGMHLKIEAGAPARGRLDLRPIDKPHRPSVDVLLESAAAAFGEHCVGVVLTGMGDDGVLGARALRAANAVVLTEAESSCVVYGMPRSVAEAGMSSAQAPLDRMAEEIQRWI